jgi:hypothetical protein
LRCLADESVDSAITRRLRREGHDVRSVAEEYPGSSDEEVAAIALADERILLTEDRDFGRLVYARLQATCGVILMRYPARARVGFPEEMVELLGKYNEQLVGAFVVAQPGRSRIDRLPSA